MSISAPPASTTALGGTAEAAPGRAVTWLAIRQVRRGGLVVTALAAGMTALVAATYEREIRVAVRRFIATLEPAIIVVLGLVVLGIVLSILLAILSVNELPL